MSIQKDIDTFIWENESLVSFVIFLISASLWRAFSLEVVVFVMGYIVYTSRLQTRVLTPTKTHEV